MGGTAVSFAPTLIRATAANRSAALEYVEDLPPRGDADIMEAFQKAFSLLNASAAGPEGVRSPHIGTTCTSTILFLVDGTHPIPNTDDILQKVAGWNQGIGARVLTYALGTGTDVRTLGTQLACSSRGLWQTIEDVTDVKDAMAHYYEFLAVGLDLHSPVWTDP